MMTISVGMRELARNSHILDDYDYVDIEDKKTHEYKGLLISPKYADEFKRFLEKKLANEKQEKLDRAMQYIGQGKIDKSFDNLTSSQIKEKKAMGN